MLLWLTCLCPCPSTPRSAELQGILVHNLSHPAPDSANVLERAELAVDVMWALLKLGGAHTAQPADILMLDTCMARAGEELREFGGRWVRSTMYVVLGPHVICHAYFVCGQWLR